MVTEHGRSVAAATLPEGEIVVCPRCGATAPTGSLLCRVCFEDLREREPASEQEAKAALAVESAAAARRRTRRRLRRAAAGASAILAAVAIWFLSPLSDSPPAPLPAASGERTLKSVAAEWPMPGGGLRGTRVTPAAAVLDGEPAWTWEAGARVTAALIADERGPYIALADGRLVALSVDDGGERWTAMVPGMLDAAPAVVGDRLYVGFRNATVNALDAATGELVWSTGSEQSVSSTPLVVDGYVIVAANGLMLAFDAEDGKLLWRQPIDDTLVPVTPAIEGDHLAVATFTRLLFFDRTTGEQTSWFKFAPRQAPALSVAVREGTVVTVAQGLVAALDADMRRPWWDGIRGMWRGLNIMGIAPDLPWRPDLWSEPAPRAPYPAVADEERVIVAGLRGDVRAYALRSGELLWERRGAAISAAPVLTADGLLLAGRGSLTLLDPADGSELRRVELAGVTPLDLIVTQQATYLLTESGRLLALRP